MTADATAGANSIDQQRAAYGRGEVVLVVERPAPAGGSPAFVRGPLVVSGYALSRAGVETVLVEVAGRTLELAVQRRRPEVRLAFLDFAPPRPQLTTGFELRLDGDGWAPGVLTVRASARDGAGAVASTTVAAHWTPDRERLLEELELGRPLLWWSSPASADPPAGDFVPVRGIVAAARGEPRVTVMLNGRPVRPMLSAAGPDIRRWAARDVRMSVYNAILDVRDLPCGEHVLSVSVEDDDGAREAREGMIRVDRGERYRRWQAARPANGRRPPAAAAAPGPVADAVAVAPDAAPIVLDVCVAWDGAESTALLDTLALQEHSAWRLRPLGGVPVALLEHPDWTRFAREGRLLAPAGDLTEVLGRLASGDDDAPAAVVLTRPGDELVPGALARLAQRFAAGPAEGVVAGSAAGVVARPAADVVYADDERDVGGGEIVPRLKPGWSPQLLLAGDYAGPLLAVGAIAARAALATDAPISSGYELLVALVDQDARVERVPEVLSRLGADGHDAPAGLGDEPAGAQEDRALAALARRLDREVIAEPVAAAPLLRRVRWPLRVTPTVSIVIPTTGEGPWIEPCLRSLRECTAYDRLQVILVDSGSGAVRELAQEQLAGIAHAVVSYRPPDRIGPRFNFSRACNLGAERCEGEYVLFINDDVEAIQADWLRRMVEYGALADVGAVGIRLVSPGGLLQSCGLGGLHPGRGEWPTDLLKGLEGSSSGPRDILTVAHERAAVTGACMLVRRDVLSGVGGWNEAFALDLGDWELCMRLWAAGRRVLVVPWVAMIHHETSTRSSLQDWSLLEGLVAPWRALHRDGDPWLHPSLRGASYPNLDLEGDEL